jgi:hypothetical protein
MWWHAWSSNNLTSSRLRVRDCGGCGPHAVLVTTRRNCFCLSLFVSRIRRSALRLPSVSFVSGLFFCVLKCIGRFVVNFVF